MGNDDMLVEANVGHDISFLDVFSVYNQILMHPDN